MGVGQGLRASKQSPRGDGQRQQGTGWREVRFLGQRTRAGESPRHPGSSGGGGSSHTNHTSTAAAAPAPSAHTGTVAERIKAQDSADAVPDQHHLGERAAWSGGAAAGAGGWGRLSQQVPPRQPLTPDLPAEAGALRGAQEGRIGLVGAGDDCGHGALVSG